MTMQKRNRGTEHLDDCYSMQYVMDPSVRSRPMLQPRNTELAKRLSENKFVGHTQPEDYDDMARVKHFFLFDQE